MTNSYKESEEKASTPHLLRSSSPLLLIPFVLLFALYVGTLAQVPVFGDPTEYTVMSHILGIAHPPGYAFFTLMGKLFQTIMPFGTVAWRSHLLSAVVGTTTAVFAYLTIKTIAQKQLHSGLITAVSLFTALTIGLGSDWWQHSIHANPHLVTATFLAANLLLLTKWWTAQETETDGNKWLYLFSLSAGLGVSHHPLTVFGFPAYTLFILLVRPSILKEWRTILKMLAFALLGLAVWLYYPLRSPSAPFGPTSMNTMEGFLTHILARGLTGSLPYFTLAEQPHRALVFWSLLRLQYSLPVIFLAFLGSTLPYYERARERWDSSVVSIIIHALRHPVTLYLIAFFSFYAFVISLKAQDIMAYALGLFVIIGLLAGVGAFQFLLLLKERGRWGNKWLAGLVASFFLLGPALQLLHNLPVISLRQYDEAQLYVKAVFDEFNGADGVTLLNDWEHMTPLWYAEYVDEHVPDGVQVEFVSAAKPWIEFVFDFLPGGDVYLSNYRRDVVDGGFRLRPKLPFYQVVEPGNSTLPSHLTPITPAPTQVEIVGYEMEETAVLAGDYIPLTLAMRVPITTTDYLVPIVRVGEMEHIFTTDSHLVTPNWLADEIIIEQFDFPLPHNLATGDYPVSVGIKNLSTDTVLDLDIPLETLSVMGQTRPIATNHLLANFRQQVGLRGAEINGQTAPIAPLSAKAGDTINVVLEWESLAQADESYTVFVHLIDLANRPIIDDLDYTPLGGAFPTHLWIPKWLSGQQVRDPYRMELPANLPAGEYLIEVGLYEMVGKRRLHIFDKNGNLVGDRTILGTIIVE